MCFLYWFSTLFGCCFSTSSRQVDQKHLDWNSLCFTVSFSPLPAPGLTCRQKSGWSWIYRLFVCFSTSLCPAAAGLLESRERSANSDCSWRERECVCQRCNGVEWLLDIVLPKIPQLYLSVFISSRVCMLVLFYFCVFLFAFSYGSESQDVVFFCWVSVSFTNTSSPNQKLRFKQHLDSFIPLH